MITNERQYRITKAQAARFAKALAELAERPAVPGEHPVRRQLERDALKGQLDDLDAQLAEYDGLRTGRIAPPDLTRYEDLPCALIRSRIAAGLTQRQLADRLDLPEQEIQRYEASVYSGASFSRLHKVMIALVRAHRELDMAYKTSLGAWVMATPGDVEVHVSGVTAVVSARSPAITGANPTNVLEEALSLPRPDVHLTNAVTTTQKALVPA